jgi:hypothetical protein
MAEQDERASEMEHAREVLQVILVTRDQPTKILEPCKTTAQSSIGDDRSGATILRQVRAVRAVRSSPHRSLQFSIKLVRIASIIANQIC